MKRNIEKLEKVIRSKFVDEFSWFPLFKVSVREGVDHDGDDVLYVDVVFNGSEKDIDAKKLVGAVRKIRPFLLDMDEDAFPIFSFISKKDYSELNREPARSH